MDNVRPDRASVLSVDTVEPDRSNIPKDLAALIGDLPGIRRNPRGQPIAVSEVAVYVQARRKDSGNAVGFPMIGAGAALTNYAPELHLTAGRMFQPGLRELIASNAARTGTRISAWETSGSSEAANGASWGTSTSGARQGAASCTRMRTRFSPPSGAAATTTSTSCCSPRQLLTSSLARSAAIRSCK